MNIQIIFITMENIIIEFPDGDISFAKQIGKRPEFKIYEKQIIILAYHDDIDEMKLKNMIPESFKNCKHKTIITGQSIIQQTKKAYTNYGINCEHMNTFMDNLLFIEYR